jgi:hypothetical protein
MAEREAAVKLTLDNAQFVVSIKRAGDEVDKVGARGKKSLGLWSVGADAAKKSVMDLGGAVKRTLGLAVTLGGAFSMGAALKTTIALQSQYARLAFRIQQSNGQMLRTADVQQIVERASAATGRTNAEMVDTFAKLRDATGDVDFAKDSLQAVGTTAMGTGASLDTLVTLTDQLHTKFGVTAAGMQDALAQVWGAAGQGGPAFDELAETMSTVGAEALAAGLKGKEGLGFVLGALVNTDDGAAGLSKQVRGLRALLRGLGEKGELQKLAAGLGIDSKKLINEKDAIARLRTIFTQGKKGADALIGSMHEGEEKETLKVLFVDPFEQALKDAQKSGLKGKAAIDKALVSFDQQIQGFGKSATKGAAIISEANARREDPEQKLTEALGTLNKAFAQPEIIAAINDLAKELPNLAKVVGEIVTWAAKHPLLAGGAAIGVKGGLAAGSAVAGAALKGLFASGAGAAGAGAAGAEVAAAGGAAATAGGAGAAAGGGAAVAAGLALLPAAIFAAIGAGGLIAQRQIKSAYEEEGDVMKELASSTAAGFTGGGTKEGLQWKLDRLQTAYKATSDADVGNGITDSLARVFGGPDIRDTRDEQMKMAAEAIERLQAMIAAKEAKPAAAGAAAAAEKPTVKLDSDAGKIIGVATATALGGKVLDVRIANAGELGFGRSAAGPGSGSRGPKLIPRTQPGGGV